MRVYLLFFFSIIIIVIIFGRPSFIFTLCVMKIFSIIGRIHLDESR